jgi:hypothetical protein
MTIASFAGGGVGAIYAADHLWDMAAQGYRVYWEHVIGRDFGWGFLRLLPVIKDAKFLWIYLLRFYRGWSLQGSGAWCLACCLEKRGPVFTTAFSPLSQMFVPNPASTLEGQSAINITLWTSGIWTLLFSILYELTQSKSAAKLSLMLYNSMVPKRILFLYERNKYIDLLLHVITMSRVTGAIWNNSLSCWLSRAKCFPCENSEGVRGLAY